MQPPLARAAPLFHQTTCRQDIISRTTTAQYRAPEMCDLYSRQVISEKVPPQAIPPPSSLSPSTLLNPLSHSVTRLLGRCVGAGLHGLPPGLQPARVPRWQRACHPHRQIHDTARTRSLAAGAPRAQFPAFFVVTDFPCMFHLTPTCSSSTSSPPALSSTPANARPVRTFCGACPVCATSNFRPQAGRFSFTRPIYVRDSKFQDSAAANAVWDRLMQPLAVSATLQPRAHRGAVKLDK